MPVDRYVPEDVTDFEALTRELDRISNLLNLLVDGEREILYSVPVKPTIGMNVFADGTSWNPGSGMGAYSYEGTSTASVTWVKL